MFLNILRISASNVLKMFLNTIVSIGSAVVIFIRTNQPEVQTNRKYKPTGSTNQPEVQTNRKHKPTGSTNQPEAQTNREHRCALLNYPLPWPIRKKYYTKSKRFKTNLHMHNTKGDVALTNINRESYPNFINAPRLS